MHPAGAVISVVVQQRLAAAVPCIYMALSNAASTEWGAVACALADAACVWVGNGFTEPGKVALHGPLSLAPLLYVLPAELNPFQVCTLCFMRQP